MFVSSTAFWDHQVHRSFARFAAALPLSIPSLHLRNLLGQEHQSWRQQHPGLNFLLSVALEIGGAIAVYVIISAGTQATLQFLNRRRSTAKLPIEGGAGQQGSAGTRALIASLRLNEYEKAIAETIVSPETLTVTFEQIGGLEAQKKEIRDLVILPLQRPDLFRCSPFPACLWPGGKKKSHTGK